MSEPTDDETEHFLNLLASLGPITVTEAQKAIKRFNKSYMDLVLFKLIFEKRTEERGNLFDA